MLRRPYRPPPTHESSGLLEETMLLLIQHLVARHPDLLAPPEENDPTLADPSLVAAHRVLHALHEVAEALDDYRYALDHAHAPNAGAHDDRRL